jgi:hypothetical protein
MEFTWRYLRAALERHGLDVPTNACGASGGNVATIWIPTGDREDYVLGPGVMGPNGATFHTDDFYGGLQNEEGQDLDEDNPYVNFKGKSVDALAQHVAREVLARRTA